MTSEAVSEMTFEEEVVLYRKEAEAEFTKEKGDCDSNGVNNILRRGMRIIRKAEERLAATQHQKEYRPQGRWLKTQEQLGWDEVDCAECSECHESWVVDMDYDYDFLEFWHYCPNCGAKMDEEEMTIDQD